MFVTFDNFQAALKLVLGQLAGYPLLLFYRFITSSIKQVCTSHIELMLTWFLNHFRRHIAHRETNLQHLYLFLSGFHKFHHYFHDLLLLSLLRFTSWSLGCWGRCDPQPLHNRFTCSSIKVGFKWISTTGATYLILQVCGGTSLSVGLTFVLNLSYLLAGYWSASCSMYFKTLPPLRYNGLEYDVSWTMPQCVLCLRLIG